MLTGVDIGGTFTDLVLSDNGQLKIHKLLSTPDNPAQAMLAGLETISPGGLSTLTQVAHGSTVATNAILERKGAKTAFITTHGFRDMLLIGRQERPELYALHPALPPPLIPPHLCYDIPERVDHHGEVLLPLDTDKLDHVLDRLADQDIQAVAICFLYSYVNPEHEEQVRDRILERGLMEDWQIALSSRVLPQFREYERASTVTLEAYVRPVMNRYIHNLQASLPETTTLRIMKSDGGMMNADHVREQAIHTALSGPAAGVIGAFHLAKLAGYDQIITLDMGGTSTDVSLCPGESRYSVNSQIDGLPLRARLLDIETIGAGGGSIARVDAGGALRVGPESAGASPGPIIYNQGGTEITVSDANALMGRLDTDHFLDGRMSLNIKAAQQAFKKLADQTGLSPVETARGVINVANVNIDRALRRVSVARGYDPRQFTLVASGGAGPLHACEVASGLNIPRVLIPRYPGVLCALGLLVADVRVDYALPVMLRATRNSVARLRAMQAEILSMGRDALIRENIPEDRMSFNVMLDMRYEGQAHELTIPFIRNVVRVFHETHEQTYGHMLPDRPVEIINIRLEATGSIDKPVLKAEPAGDPGAHPAKIGEKASPVGSGTITLYERDKLMPGMHFSAEALVFQEDSTVYLAPGWRAFVDGYRNLILECV